MSVPTGRIQRWPGHEAARRSTRPVPRIVRRGITTFGWRHGRGVVVIRLVVAVWLVILGSIFCSLGHWYWWGALLFLPAGLNGWLAYQVPRWKRALVAEKDIRLPR
jgi:hypothetical protein